MGKRPGVAPPMLHLFRRALLLLLVPPPAAAQDRFITLASTTSTEQSGLFGHILPLFTQETGIAVRVVALGTGQALDVARRGDADAVLVHDRAAEERFVAEGHGGPRRPVMFTDFVLIGPQADPAGIAGLDDAAAALRRIATAGAAFTCGCRAGFTAMTPYWLNSRRSPASSSRSAWRLRKASQVPRSARI